MTVPPRPLVNDPARVPHEERRKPCGSGQLPPAEIGPILAAARARSGLSFRALARLVGASAGHLCMVEHARCRPSASLAASLVHHLRLTGSDAKVILAAGVPGVGRDFPLRHGATRPRRLAQMMRGEY